MGWKRCKLLAAKVATEAMPGVFAPTLDIVHTDKELERHGDGWLACESIPGFGLSDSDKPRKTDEHPPGCSPIGESLTGNAVLGQVPSGLDLSDSDKARRTDEHPPGRSPCGEGRTGIVSQAIAGGTVSAAVKYDP